MPGITPQPGIMNIRLYQGGQSALAGVDDVLKLSSNENPRGPSPAAMEALGRGAEALHRYPPTDHAELRATIGAVHGLDPDKIICGVGSDEILQFVAQCFAGPGDEVIHTEHGFSMYPLLAHAVGATPVPVPETARVVDVDAILAAVTPRTRIVFIANPGNPTGTMIPMDEVARLADSLPPQVVLVHDGAYTEFVEGSDGGAALAGSRDNVIMTRTFSKIYGLGGLRIGWGYAGRTMINVLNRVRQPFNLSTTQIGVAVAALGDNDYVAACRDENAAERARLTALLHRLDIGCDTSQANFVLARFADAAEASTCDAHLKSRGILVRGVAGYGLPHCLRVTVPDAASAPRLAAAFESFRETAR